MPAFVATTVASFEMILFCENEEAVFHVKIILFDF
jgi:hypothetical protein